MGNVEPDVPIRTVLAFCDAWSRLDMGSVIALLDNDIEYHNIPLQPLSGKRDVEAYLRGIGPFEACSWTVRSIAANGPVVLTERIDAFVVGGTQITLPVMGVFEVVDARIRGWRDYFDLASYRAQWSEAEARG
ncbi:MAG TPA: limonene-1,2-epoxide hydrolase family protein [Allosphingosinicella sp.]|jgi:limonene-1,2-epoxide hydrolase